MKTKLLLFSGLFILFSAYGQTDKQWLISNFKGKEGLEAGLNYFHNTLPGDFDLIGIKHPAASLQKAANDILVIYPDGRHYNSRFQPGRGFFYPDDAHASARTNTTHTFHPGQSGVAYMYLTNRYEEDEPPKLVYVRATTNPTDPIYELQTTDNYAAGTLQANHNVVRNKDITLIIDLSALRRRDTVPSKRKIFTLLCDKVINLGTAPPLSNANFFNLQSVFYDPNLPSGSGNLPTAGFPPGACTISVGSNAVVLNQTSASPFAYVNIRPSNLIDGCVPNNLGEERYKALFRIIDEEGTQVAELQERILNSYDPNYIKVEHICKPRSVKGNQMVYYYLQFRNTSVDVPAKKLKVTLKFPKEFLTDCFDVLSWSPNIDSSANRAVFDRLDRSAITFTCDPAASLRMYDPLDTISCTGFIRFRIGVPGLHDLTDLQNSLRLINPLVYFDGISYPIDDFQEKLIIKHDPLEREIKEGNCRCQNPVYYPWIIGALLVAGIAITVAVKRRKRKIRS